VLWALYSTVECVERQLPAERRIRRHQARIRRVIESAVTHERIKRWWQLLNKQAGDPIGDAGREEADRAVSAIVLALLEEIEQLRLEAAEFAGRGLPAELKEQAIQEAFELVRNIPDTIREGLRDIMRKTLAEYHTQFDFARAIRRRWREFSRRRSEVIARTEWARVAGRAQLELYKQQGIEGKLWITLGDERVCPVCQKNAEVGPIKIDAPFPGGVLTVPQHPICRCSVASAALPKAKPQYAELRSIGEVSQFASNYDDWVSALSHEEREALRDYKGFGYKQINRSLRRGYDHPTARMIDSALAKAPPLPMDVKLYRGIKRDALPRKLAVGDILEDKGYVSTTLDRSLTRWFGGTRLEILAKAGLPGVFLDRFGAAEWEVLLPRGAKFRVVDVQRGLIVLEYLGV
jgi:SPP1 gp7 family putative phage head morphogenesis protein